MHMHYYSLVNYFLSDLHYQEAYYILAKTVQEVHQH